MRFNLTYLTNLNTQLVLGTFTQKQYDTDELTEKALTLNVQSMARMITKGECMWLETSEGNIIPLNILKQCVFVKAQ